MMAKFVLQLPVIAVVLTFFLIVIDHYVCGANEHVRVYRGDYDIFENPNHINCTARNAITFPDTNSGYSRCKCFDRYKTYLHSFDRCVRDDELSFLTVLKNSFMIEHDHPPSMPPMCITYDRSHDITAAMCNSSDSSQQWIWTRYSQLLHVETLKCVQQSQIFPGKNDTWYLRLKECNMSEKKQKWKCEPHYNLRQTFRRKNRQQDFMYITYENGMILAKVKALTPWKRYQSNSGTENKVCHSSFRCNEFTNSSSIMLVLDSKCQQQGEQQIADLPMGKRCSVNGIEVWDNHYWKNLDHHEFRENIFAISNTMTLADKFLKWNFTRAPSNWTNLVMKLNFSCSGCVLIKLKYSPSYYPTSRATTVSSSEAAPTKSPTSAISAKTAESYNGIVTTSHPPHTKSTTSSKEQQEGESSSVVGIVVGLVVAILVLCGIILGYFCYKRKKSRLDKTSSNVEVNGKGKSSGDTLNPIYSSEDNKNPSLSNDGGIYQEPDGNANAASQECDLYEAGDDHEYDYAKVEQKNKPAPPSEELEYDYAKTDDIKSAVQRAPVRGNDYQNTVIKNKNAATDDNEDKETDNDAGPLYQTLEDETAPVYQTLESE